MKLNEASWDRIARAVLGVALILGGLLAVGGTGGYIMAGIGLVPLITGLMSWCPIYAIFRTGTVVGSTESGTGRRSLSLADDGRIPSTQ
jgi:hypothetical protein